MGGPAIPDRGYFGLDVLHQIISLIDDEKTYLHTSIISSVMVSR